MREKTEFETQKDVEKKCNFDEIYDLKNYETILKST